MRKRLMAFVVVCAIASSVKAESMSWIFSGDLGVAAAGGTVYLYEDVDLNSWGTGYTIGGGDSPTGDTTPVVFDSHGGTYNWGDSFAWTTSGSLKDGDQVYSVVFNSTMSQYRIIDSSVKVLPVSDDGPASYNLTAIGGGGWIAVPEPTTLALLGLGTVTILIGRRRSNRKHVS